MNPVIRMGIRADGQTPAAVGTDDRPVVVAGFWIDFPAQYAIVYFSILMRDGLAGAIFSTFFTDPAEIEGAMIRLIFIGDQG